MEVETDVFMDTFSLVVCPAGTRCLVVVIKLALPEAFTEDILVSASSGTAFLAKGLAAGIGLPLTGFTLEASPGRALGLVASVSGLGAARCALRAECLVVLLVVLSREVEGSSVSTLSFASDRRCIII